MGYSREERETLITTDDTMSYFLVDTRQRRIMNKMKHIEAEVLKQEFEEIDAVDEKGKPIKKQILIQATYKIPLGCLRLVKERVYTDEERAAMRERFLKYMNKEDSTEDFSEESMEDEEDFI